MDQPEANFRPQVIPANRTSNPSEAELIDSIIAALHNLAYGTVTITVHGSKVVQMDVTERQRFGA